MRDCGMSARSGRILNLQILGFNEQESYLGELFVMSKFIPKKSSKHLLSEGPGYNICIKSISGRSHCVSGPSYRYFSKSYVSKSFSIMGTYHNLNGFADEFESKNLSYCFSFVNGELHNIVDYAQFDGREYRWFICGIEYTKEEFRRIMKLC